MTKLLKEQERNIVVIAITEVEGFTYKTEYAFEEISNMLKKVVCNVIKENSYIGVMHFDGKSNFNFQEEVDTVKHIMVFRDILAEIKGELEPKD